MKFKLKNFAKIKEASINIDGITVLVGKNSTGKSTIGKALYCVFNSLYNMDNKIIRNRKFNFHKLLWDAFSNIFSSIDDDEMVLDDIYFDIKRTLENILFKEHLSKMQILDVVLDCFNNYNVSYDNEKCINFAESVVELMDVVNETSDIQLTMEILERYFSRVFNNQINSLMTDSTAEINIQIKDKQININFDNNKCTNAIVPINILHEAFLIDDSTLIDKVEDRKVYKKYVVASFQQNELLTAISNIENDIDEGIIESINAKKKLESIYAILDQTIPGDISSQGKGVSVLFPNYKRPIKVSNLSTGMKSFALIKLMLEKGVLKEKDVLILDEPEVHLHPEWQMKYAEIIVLLQKHFNLSIIVTTHSSHFLRAIEYYAVLYAINNNCNYYLSKDLEGECVFDDVSDNITEVYKELIEPSILMDDLWYRMESEDD